jgi:hypothetical protein
MRLDNDEGISIAYKGFKILDCPAAAAPQEPLIFVLPIYTCHHDVTN